MIRATIHLSQDLSEVGNFNHVFHSSIVDCLNTIEVSKN